jgi:exoribonuclease R
MRTVRDAGHALAEGLTDIRRQFKVPTGFPPEVIAAVDAAVARPLDGHVDRTAMPFVTLDPAESRDLDQAFTIERSGADLLLHYAIADVAWFVHDDDPVDAEAWRRGVSVYLPDGKAGLYPPALSEGAASLLPDGPRPAVVFTVRLAPDADPVLDGVERCVVRSVAKLAYDTVTDADLPDGFAEFGDRMTAADLRRGAARVESPEQQVELDEHGRYRLELRPRLVSEDRNAALSLATNLAVADLMLAAHTGLFRTMPAPDARAVGRLRHTARALGVSWSADESLADLERRLDGARPNDAAMAMAIRRAGGGASYTPFQAGVRPWHAAMAATYAHATAPLRRLADRYVVQTALALASGQPVPERVLHAFPLLPAVMERADAEAAQVDRAVIDLAEAVSLQHRVGETFMAVATDEDDRGVRIQLCDVAVVARVTANGVRPGDAIRVKLVSAEPSGRSVQFARVA